MNLDKQFEQGSNQNFKMNPKELAAKILTLYSEQQKQLESIISGVYANEEDKYTDESAMAKTTDEMNKLKQELLESTGGDKKKAAEFLGEQNDPSLYKF